MIEEEFVAFAKAKVGGMKPEADEELTVLEEPLGPIERASEYLAGCDPESDLAGILLNLIREARDYKLRLKELGDAVADGLDIHLEGKSYEALAIALDRSTEPHPDR